MAMKSRTGCMIIALLLCGAAPALAQTTPATPEHVPLQKTIGQAGPDIVPSLIVMNARGASLQGGKLTLTGAAPNSIVFADRPVRAAGHSLTTDLLQEWSPNNESDESFTKDPPNATVSVFSADGSKVRDAVVVLKTAKLEGDRLTFDVDVLEGDPGAGDCARLMMLVLHDDATREYACGPEGLPDTKVGTLTQALYDEAKKENWMVISMKNDWKRIFSFD